MRSLDYPEIPFHALLARAAGRWPDRAAITFRGHDLTFSRWNGDANRLANGLLNLGVIPGDRVALFMPNGPEYEIAFFGSMRMGGVPTPLNPSYKDREVRHQMADSGASTAIVHHSLLPLVEVVRAQLPDLRQVVVTGGDSDGNLSFDDLIARHPDTDPDIDVGWDAMAALPYSSGTTGASKGVILTQRNMVCNALQFTDCSATTDADTMLVFLPLYHIYGVILMATAVTAGARQILLERFDLAEVQRLIREEVVTELFVVPPVVLALADAPGVDPEDLRSLRFVKSAAAPLSPEVARRAADRLGVPILQAYGMTEASPLTHMVPLDETGIDNVGIPAPDTACKIVDLDTGQRELAPGEVGEVIIWGPQVMKGYWNAPDATTAALRDGWLYTGDVGRIDEAGRLQIVDRKKEMIKFKAFSIAPAELEAVLLEHPSVADCAVTGQPDAESGEVPHAFVVLRASAGDTPDDLMAFVAERVAGYKQIRSLEVVDAIPRTASGKILRRLLRDRAAARPSA
jgi:long-chain acyl-CoA synthetase